MLVLAIEGDKIVIFGLDDTGKTISKKVFPNKVSIQGDIVGLLESKNKIKFAISSGEDSISFSQFSLKHKNLDVSLDQDGVDIDQINFTSKINGNGNYPIKDTELEFTNTINDLHFLENSKALLEKLKDSKNKSTSNENLQNSFIELLLQALNSSDKKLLEEIFEMDDKELISSTIEKIPQSTLLVFMDELISRISAFPYLIHRYIYWMRSICIIHASTLIAYPQLNKKLAILCQKLKLRTQNYNKFCELKGKLSLLMQNDFVRVSKAVDIPLPKRIYNEGEINEEFIKGSNEFQDEDSISIEDDDEEDMMDSDKEFDEALEEEMSEDLDLTGNVDKKIKF